MGAGASSIASREDERRLFDDLAALLQREELRNDSKEDEEDEEDEGNSRSTAAKDSSAALTAAAITVVQRWEEQVNRLSKVVYCDLVDVEAAMDAAWANGKTPIVLDLSPDSKFSTFCSYQTDMIPLEAKSLILTASSRSVIAALEEGRRHLVSAMATGKTLYFKLSNTAPDITGLLNDKHAGFDTKGKRSAYFPLELFECGGAKLHDPTLEQSLADGLLLDMPDKTVVVVPELMETDDLVCDDEENEPKVARPKRVSWAERLFRDEDMRPNKNFAICKRTFKVFLSGEGLSEREAIEEYWRGEHGLPNFDFFQIIRIVNEEKEEQC